MLLLLVFLTSACSFWANTVSKNEASSVTFGLDADGDQMEEEEIRLQGVWNDGITEFETFRTWEPKKDIGIKTSEYIKITKYDVTTGATKTAIARANAGADVAKSLGESATIVGSIGLGAETSAIPAIMRAWLESRNGGVSNADKPTTPTTEAVE